MFKFKIKQRVRKKEGYIFEGVVMSRYLVNGQNKFVKGGIRYDVKIDSEPFIKYLNDVAQVYGLPTEVHGYLARYINNGSGMIHIFSEEQLELVL